jgi:DNA primase
MDHAGMSFIEAVEDLAQQFGMKVPERTTPARSSARRLLNNVNVNTA